MRNPDDYCHDTGYPHVPDWSTAKMTRDGDEIVVEVNCAKCGAYGCVGTIRNLAENIRW